MPLRRSEVRSGTRSPASSNAIVPVAAARARCCGRRAGSPAPSRRCRDARSRHRTDRSRPPGQCADAGDVDAAPGKAVRFHLIEKGERTDHAPLPARQARRTTKKPSPRSRMRLQYQSTACYGSSCILLLGRCSRQRALHAARPASIIFKLVNKSVAMDANSGAA